MAGLSTLRLTCSCTQSALEERERMAIAENREESDREEELDPEALGMPEADEEDVGNLTPVFAADENMEEAAADFAHVSRPLAEESDLDATRIYLNEIGASRLLTAEEEVRLARLTLSQSP